MTKELYSDRPTKQTTTVLIRDPGTGQQTSGRTPAVPPSPPPHHPPVSTP